MENDNGKYGCLIFVIIIIIAVNVVNFFDPDAHNERYGDDEPESNGNYINEDDYRMCIELGGNGNSCN
ncbi:hypothetical protein [Cytobacillus firmus]|uniref:Uncharacterized protein n=1 Tax=Cytobacillus firmus DS1 TaxID=1307436 RepID=W7LHQ6_CYTFI|nr:hypothetical protein [Cytobacillus firmus]EWG11609.1 hypothetical protein PBF_08653 [Cytobacillus firmus DS1]